MRERIKDWGQGFCRVLGKRMVELTGDYTPDMVGGTGALRVAALPRHAGSREAACPGWATRLRLTRADQVQPVHACLAGCQAGRPECTSFCARRPRSMR